MKRFYHWVVEDVFTGERKEIVKSGKPVFSPRYRVIGCCGYHEKEAAKDEKE